ncbi:hypothetical protein LTR37_019656 [Vermiconidia calcicola]|uniref:Uncharacterized protein n=1 Tax=Vermiconidia calcicola TaxID=1690605 RepID=A0ACC3MDH0_9PEZI|nr:hypothetical protein LTR37_019656 [Vermiconidia calcicola]
MVSQQLRRVTLSSLPQPASRQLAAVWEAHGAVRVKEACCVVMIAVLPRDGSVAVDESQDESSESGAPLFGFER